MSDEMKQMFALMKEMSIELKEVKAEVAALKKQPKPSPAKEEKPDTSFAGLYGALLTNADGSGKKFKHSADTKDGDEDDWFGVWDAKNKVIKRINEDGSDTDEVYETCGDFGTAHYKSLGENNAKKNTHDSNGGWDKVKVMDSVKRKWCSASTLLPQGKPRSQSRAKSASRRSNAAASAGGGGGGAELNIAKPKKSRKPQASPQPSPKEVARAAVVLVAAAAHTDDKFFYFKDEDNHIEKISSADDVEVMTGGFEDDDLAYWEKHKEEVFNALCEWDEENDRKGINLEDFDNIFTQVRDA